MLQRFRQLPIAQRLRRLVRGGPRILPQGVGAGLWFDSHGAGEDYARGVSELPVQEALAKHIHSGAVVYDIGANVGFFTIIAAQLTGSIGQVYAFEPVPANYAAIEHNARLNRHKHVVVLPYAVSDASGAAQLTLAQHIGGATLAAVGAPPDAAQTITVEAVALDDLIGSALVRPPSVVKIDVEGAELQVLRGMRRTIDAHRPVIIYEVDDADLAVMRRKQADCDALLRAHGYRITPLAESYPGVGWHVAHGVALPV